MLECMIALWLASAPAQACTTPILSRHYDARAVTAESLFETCYVCQDAVTIVTETDGQQQSATRAIVLPDISAAMHAIRDSQVDEICDGPMDVAGVEYWMHGGEPRLFSAAGSACWVQSQAVDEATEVEALIDRLCAPPTVSPASPAGRRPHRPQTPPAASPTDRSPSR